MQAKDFLSFGPAAMTGSQASDLVVPLLQKTCSSSSTTTTTISPIHSHVLCFSLQGIVRDDNHDLRCFTEPTRQNSSQQFSSECHLCQKIESGSDLSGSDEYSHAHICKKIILHRCTRSEIYSTTVSFPGLEQHFTTLLGFISKYRYHQKHLLENTITCQLFVMPASVIISFQHSAFSSSISS